MTTRNLATAIVFFVVLAVPATTARAQHCDDPLGECSGVPCPCANSCAAPGDVCPEGTVCLPFGFPGAPCTPSDCFCDGESWGGSDDCSASCVPTPDENCAEPQGPCSESCPAVESCATDADCPGGSVCVPTGVPGVECIPAYCYCDASSDVWFCGSGCANVCVADNPVPAVSSTGVLVIVVGLLLAGRMVRRRVA